MTAVPALTGAEPSLRAILDDVGFGQRFATVLRYCDDPEYRAAIDAERDTEQARLNAIITANIARYRAARERAVLASVGSEG